MGGNLNGFGNKYDIDTHAEWNKTHVLEHIYKFFLEDKMVDSRGQGVFLKADNVFLKSRKCTDFFASKL